MVILRDGFEASEPGMEKINAYMVDYVRFVI
jgi:hypothetical protein